MTLGWGSKGQNLISLIHCLLLLPLFVAFLCWVLVCCAVLCVLSSFAITPLEKRELVALFCVILSVIFLLSFSLFLTVPWVGLSRGTKAGKCLPLQLKGIQLDFVWLQR